MPSLAPGDRVPRNAVGMAVAPRRCGVLLYISVAFTIPGPILATQSPPTPCSAPGQLQPSARLEQASCPDLLLLQERTRGVPGQTKVIGFATPSQTAAISRGSPRARRPSRLAPIPALT